MHLTCDFLCMQRVQLLKSAGLPAVYAEWLHAGEGAPTVLIYGHYGKQALHTPCMHSDSAVLMASQSLQLRGQCLCCSV